METNKLYVGNLNYKATSEDVKNIFAKHGNVVSVKLIEKDGLKKGFGFVEFENASEASTAKDALADQDFMNRKLKIDFAKPPKPKSARM